MSDIFISYSSADSPRIEPIVGSFKRKGWSVWWDYSITPGRRFDEVIEEELAAASCVVVFWTKTSVTSRWVTIEASEGAARDVLIPVLLDDGLKIPLEFKRIHAVCLIGWDGNVAHAEFIKLLSAITSKISIRRVAGSHNEEYYLTPRVDVTEGDDSYVVMMDIPGIRPDEVEIWVESSSLIVKGIRRLAFYGGQQKFLSIEREAMRFYRKIDFPEDIEGKSIMMDYRDGVLALHISKS